MNVPRLMGLSSQNKTKSQSIHKNSLPTSATLSTPIHCTPKKTDFSTTIQSEDYNQSIQTLKEILKGNMERPFFDLRVPNEETRLAFKNLKNNLSGGMKPSIFASTLESMRILKGVSHRKAYSTNLKKIQLQTKVPYAVRDLKTILDFQKRAKETKKFDIKEPYFHSKETKENARSMQTKIISVIMKDHKKINLTLKEEKSNIKELRNIIQSFDKKDFIKWKEKLLMRNLLDETN